MIPLAMAYFKVGAEVALLCWLPVPVISVLAGGLLPSMIAAKGEKWAFLFAMAYLFSSNFILFLGPFNLFMLYGQAYYSNVFFQPFQGLYGNVTGRYLTDLAAKHVSFTQLIAYTTNVVVAPSYAYIFDARATTYWPMVVPMLFSFGCRMGEFLTVYHPTKGSFQFISPELAAMAKERFAQKAAAEGQAEKKDEAKADSEKKDD